MPDPLERVQDAARERERAASAFVQALQDARDAGYSGAAIAARAGVTRQRVLQLTENPANTEAGMTRRLAELDARWDRLVDAIAPRFAHPDPRGEQARRNVKNGRAAKRYARSAKACESRGIPVGRPPVRIPTVAEETRNLAETYLLRFLENDATHPLLVNVRRELDEAASLREKLAALQDARVPWLHDPPESTLVRSSGTSGGTGA